MRQPSGVPYYEYWHGLYLYTICYTFTQSVCPTLNGLLGIAGCPTLNAPLSIAGCPTLNALLSIAGCPTWNVLVHISVPCAV